MLKIANFIHTRGKLAQIVLTSVNFLIIGITIIWCHSFTKLTNVGAKFITG
jgi:hypothetical protein